MWLPYSTSIASFGSGPVARSITGKLALAGGLTSPFGGLAAQFSSAHRVTPRMIGQGFTNLIDTFKKKK